MHCNGYCHLDLSLENVLWDKKNDLVKICDFGLARNLAPEMYAYQRFNREKADVFSLGVHRLTGFPPFTTPNASDIIWHRIQLSTLLSDSAVTVSTACASHGIKGRNGDDAYSFTYSFINVVQIRRDSVILCALLLPINPLHPDGAAAATTMIISSKPQRRRKVRHMPMTHVVLACSVHILRICANERNLVLMHTKLV
eukprot:726223_1